MTLAQQQKLDQLCFGLLVGGSFLATGMNYFTKQGFWNAALSHTALITLIVFQPFYFWQVYSIGKGKRWAKILYLVLTGLGELGLLLAFRRIATKTLTSHLATFNFTFQQVLSLAVAVILVLTLRRPTPEVVADEEEYY